MTLIAWQILVYVAGVALLWLGLASLPALPPEALEAITWIGAGAQSLDRILPVHEALDVLTAYVALFIVAWPLRVILKAKNRMRVSGGS